MLDLIIKNWYRQQKTIDDLKIFKFLIMIASLVGLFIANCIFYIILNFNNKFESFIFLNIFSMILTQYNLPNIQEELRNEKIKSFFYFDNFFKYILFTIIKKNFLIIIFAVISLVNIVISLFTDPLNALSIICLIFLQLNIIFFRFAGKKLKAVLITLSAIYCGFIFLNFNLVNIPICLINIILYKLTLKSMFLYNSNTKNYTSIKSTYLKDNFIFYILTFLKRIKKNEYIEILLTSILGIVLYKFAGIKYLSYLIIIFFITKLQLVIENKQISYKKTYLKNAFFNTLNISTKKKILYSTEAKILLLEFITLISIFLFLLFYKGSSLYLFVWVINLALLMYLNLSKYMKTFYYYLDNKYYFKGMALNIVLIYIILIDLNFDIILKYLKFTTFSDLIIEIFKLAFTILCILIKFEKLFMSKNFRRQNEKEF